MIHEIVTPKVELITHSALLLGKIPLTIADRQQALIENDVPVMYLNEHVNHWIRKVNYYPGII